MKPKLIAILLVALLVMPFGFLSTYAEETEALTETAIETATSADTVCLNPDTVVTVKFTEDSLVTSGISYEIRLDELTNTVNIVILDDLDFGYVIYDDTSTEYIDGIRVNGNTITSLKVPIDPDITEYTIIVKTTYSDGVSGTVAKLMTGNITFDDIFNSPLLLLQMVYYVIAALSIILGGFGVLNSKKKKIKTAEDIASLVDIRAKELQTGLDAHIAEIITQKLIPIVDNAVSTNQNVIKAVALSTSKAKSAPTELLELLQKAGNVETAAAIESIKQNVSKAIADEEQNRKAISEGLNKITNTSSQEVVEYAKATTEEKSVF